MNYKRTLVRWGWVAVIVTAAVVWACSGAGNGGGESVGQSYAADTSQPGATCAQGYLNASASVSGSMTTLHNGSYAPTVSSFPIPATIPIVPGSGKASGLSFTLGWIWNTEPSPYNYVSCNYTSSTTGDQQLFSLSTCTSIIIGVGTTHPTAGYTYTSPKTFTLTLSGSGTMSLSIPLGSTPLDDGNPCTFDKCSATGGVTSTNAPAGTPCGCGTCNGDSYCQPDPLPHDAGSTCTPSLACVSGQWVTQGTSTCSAPAHDAGAFNATIATNLVNSAAFLFTGPDGGTGSINPTDVAVVRGRVFANATTRSSAPSLLANATVSILGHPEFGTVQTRADGWYDIAVNGGGQVTVVVAGPSGTSYFPVQRQLATLWHQYAVVPDIYLTPKDANANAITLGSTSGAAASGTTMTDPIDPSATPHTARVVFPAGTTATFACTSSTTCPGGGSCVSGTCSGAAPTSVTVHATEYTYGASGPGSLPGNLPPSTAYTYAVELNSDEADAYGASLVFSSPVFFYVENFIKFPLGAVVPVGFYDRAHGHWVASPNGEVVEIASFGPCSGASGMCAVLSPAPAVAPGVSELQELYTLYGTQTPPIQLWRVPIPHFSGWDMNWPFSPPNGAGGPPGGAGPPDGPITDPVCMAGSIIECQNSILAEEFPLIGTPYKLRYQSERAPGRAPILSVPITGATIPYALNSSGVSQLVRVDVNIVVAGVAYDVSYPVSVLVPNQSLTWPWNRLDPYGNRVEGMQEATVTVSYIYNGQYVPPAKITTINSDFAIYPPADGGAPYVLTADRIDNTLAVSSTSFSRIGVQDPEPQGLGGLTVSVNHLYDPDGQVLWGGDGTRRNVSPLTRQMDSVPNGTVASSAAVAVAADGSIVFANNAIVQRLSPPGVPTTIAGGGSGSTYAATPVPASSFSFEGIYGLAIAPSGLIYTASNGLINVIDPVASTVTTVAGMSSGGATITGCTDAPIGTAGTLTDPTTLAMAPDGSLYVTDRSCGTLRRLGTDGSLSTVTAPAGFATYTNGTVAAKISLTDPTSVAVGSDGTIYVSDNYPHTGRRVTRIDGKTSQATLVAGGVAPPSMPWPSYDGTLAVNLPLVSTTGSLLAVGPDGTLYVTSTNTGTWPATGAILWGIDALGMTHFIAGNGPMGIPNEGDTGPAFNAAISGPSGLGAALLRRENSLRAHLLYAS